MISIRDIALNRVKLRPLVIFSRVLQFGSVVQAAADLHLTQPAVTKAVRELEEMLQVKLFIRKASGMEPTQEGLRLGGRVNMVMTQLRYLLDDMNCFKEGNSGRVVVGTLLSGSVHLLPSAIVALKEANPKIIVTVKVGTLEKLFPALLKGELDLVVGRLPQQGAALRRQYPLEHMPLFGEKLCLVVSPQHPLLKTDFTLEDLLGYTWLVPLPGSEMRGILEGCLQARGLPFPEDVIESMSFLTDVSILIQSQAVACMSEHVAEYLLQRHLAAVLPVNDFGPDVDVGFSTRLNEPLSIASRQLVLHLHEVAASLQF